MGILALISFNSLDYWVRSQGRSHDLGMEDMSLIMRKDFAYEKTKTKRLCFCYVNSTIPLLLKPEIPSC